MPIQLTTLLVHRNKRLSKFDTKILEINLNNLIFFNSDLDSMHYQKKTPGGHFEYFQTAVFALFLGRF